MAGENLWKIHSDFLFFEVTVFFNACLWDIQIDRTQIAVHMASTRCQQSLKGVQACFLKNEQVFVVFPGCAPLEK